MLFDVERRLDPELRAVRARYPSLGFDLRDIEGSRRIMAILAERSRLADDSPVHVETTVAAQPASSTEVPLRLFRPRALSSPLPVLLWIHGGGYVLGSAADSDQRLAAIAERVGCAVAAVDYRLAPEHPYPSGLDDCATALDWLREHATDLCFDAQRIAIGGASAGGGLAAALALRTRDRGLPPPLFQLLIYPMLDDRNHHPSSHGIDDPTLWDRSTNLLAWELYLGGARDGDAVPVLAAPGRATDLASLPPAFIAVGDLDLFVDEDIVYAHQLLRAGVPVELHVYPGAIHGFDTLAPEARLSRRCNDAVESALRAAFFRSAEEQAE